jgi:hypothetical protein
MGPTFVRSGWYGEFVLSACTFADDDEWAPLGRVGIAAAGADECHHRPTHRLCATNVI